MSPDEGVLLPGTHDAVPDPRNDEILVYLNGEMVPRAEARISVFDSGFLVGDGIWEGIRLHRGRFALLDRTSTGSSPGRPPSASTSA